MGYTMRVLRAVEEVNAEQKLVLYHKLVKYYGDETAIQGKTIGMWGLAFKPETDDMREAPSLVLIDLLLKAGATVKVYDPVAMDECRRRIGDSVTYCKNMGDPVTCDEGPSDSGRAQHSRCRRTPAGRL